MKYCCGYAYHCPQRNATHCYVHDPEPDCGQEESHTCLSDMYGEEDGLRFGDGFVCLRCGNYEWVGPGRHDPPQKQGFPRRTGPPRRGTWLDDPPLDSDETADDVSRNTSWDRFAERLAEALAQLEAGQNLILSVRQRPNYYVQFERDTDDLRAECVSNAFLQEDEKHDQPTLVALLELGWNPPTPERRSGSPNHFRDYESLVAYSEVADFAITTMEKVLKVRQPDELVYKAFATTGGESFSLPILGLASEGAGIEPPTAGDVTRDIQGALESAGGSLAQVEYELSVESALGDFPADMPALDWCRHTDRGREFMASIDAAVGNDADWELIEERAAHRRWLLSGDDRQAVLIEETWTDREAGRWHARFKLRSH